MNQWADSFRHPTEFGDDFMVLICTVVEFSPKLVALLTNSRYRFSWNRRKDVLGNQKCL